MNPLTIDFLKLFLIFIVLALLPAIAGILICWCDYVQEKIKHKRRNKK